jgi:hypothetical protein
MRWPAALVIIANRQSPRRAERRAPVDTTADERSAELHGTATFHRTTLTDPVVTAVVVEE